MRPKYLFLPLLLCALYAFTAAEQKITVHMIGDSTMADKPLNNENPERGWGQYFPSLFNDNVIVKNYAMNGRSTKSFIDQGLWDNVDKAMKKGDYLFIQFGHNDSKKETPERYADPWGDYSANLKRFIEAARAKGAKPVLLTPIARRIFDEQGNLTDTHGDYPAAMKKVAAECNVPLIDLTTLTTEWITSIGDSLSRGYFMHIPPETIVRLPEGRIDNTHLVARGAGKVARLVAGELKLRFPELAKNLIDSDFVVAKDGSGDFFTVQEAIDAAPDYNKNRPTTIVVRRGTYKEKVIVPPSKNAIHLIGLEAAATVITYDNYAAKIGPTGFPLGTSGTATVYVHANDFTAEKITFENSAGPVGQALAIAVTGDRARFLHCRFVGNQDTIYTLGTDSRQYYEGCYIEGTTDFIFGGSIAFFRDCTIHSKKNSYITAASTPEGRAYGYVFENCTLTSDAGVTKVYFGRPWRPWARTVFIGCTLGAHIAPEGWHNWDKPEAEKTAFYAEYGSKGPGANPAARVKWSHRLSAGQAADYTIANVFGDWDPLVTATTDNTIR